MKSLMESYMRSKHLPERSKLDLENLLLWFRTHGKGVLKDATNEMLTDIIENCTLRTYKRGELIIAQGETGDRFYVLVHGEVDIYVNDNDELGLERHNGYNSVFLDKESRSVLGKCVATEDDGYSFGEYALFDEKSVRKASVISATDSTVIEITKDKYDRSLKAIQQSIIDERNHFINKIPLFDDWKPKIKLMLMMSLKKLVMPYGSKIVTQGEAWKGLIFITKGSGKVIIDPTNHQSQFPEFYPLDVLTYDKRYQEFPELKPSTQPLDPNEVHTARNLMPEHIRLKRTKHHGTLENHSVKSKKYICSIQPGEIIGDLEFLFSLQRNLYSVLSSEETEAFILDLNNIERLVKRLGFEKIFEKLKVIIEPKLAHREKYFKLIPIPLLSFFNFKLYDKRIENPRLLPKLKTEKQLPSEVLEWQHLLKMYQENKAPLCKPSVKGGVFLRDLMIANANCRQLSMAKNANQPKEVVVNNGINVTDPHFPITQQRIYQLQKLANTPIHLLELLYNDIRNPKLPKFQSIKRFFHNEPNPDPLPQQRDKEENNSTTPNEMFLQIPSNQNNDEEFRDRAGSRTENSRTGGVTNEKLSSLQKSEIKFLNSLCSENSMYKIKSGSNSRSERENKKVHFIPKLQPSYETQKKISPKKGGRVLIKKRKCFALESPYRLSNHNHNHFQFVKKVQFDSLLNP